MVLACKKKTCSRVLGLGSCVARKGPSMPCKLDNPASLIRFKKGSWCQFLIMKGVRDEAQYQHYRLSGFMDAETLFVKCSSCCSCSSSEPPGAA